MDTQKLIFQDLRSEDFFSSLKRKQINPYFILFYDHNNQEKHSELKKVFEEVELIQFVNKYFESRSVNTSSKDGMLIWNFLSERRFHESLTNSIVIFGINTGIKSSKHGVLKKKEIVKYLSEILKTISRFKLGDNVSVKEIFTLNKPSMISSVNR